MADYDRQLKDEIPVFSSGGEKIEKGSALDVSSTFSETKIRGAKEIVGIIVLRCGCSWSLGVTCKGFEYPYICFSDTKRHCIGTC